MLKASAKLQFSFALSKPNLFKEPKFLHYRLRYPLWTIVLRSAAAVAEGVRGGLSHKRPGSRQNKSSSSKIAFSFVYKKKERKKGI
jgi:hypothetical protein